MAVLIVTFYLHKPDNHPALVSAIKSYTWAKLSNSSYAIDTVVSPKDVFEELSKHLREKDQLYIIALTRPYFGHGHVDINTWLHDRLPGK